MNAQAFQVYPEIKEPQQCNITGDLPSWINGVLFRVGPGEFKFANKKLDHWFDGIYT